MNIPKCLVSFFLFFCTQFMTQLTWNQVLIRFLVQGMQDWLPRDIQEILDTFACISYISYVVKWRNITLKISIYRFSALNWPIWIWIGSPYWEIDRVFYFRPDVKTWTSTHKKSKSQISFWYRWGPWQTNSSKFWYRRDTEWIFVLEIWNSGFDPEWVCRVWRTYILIHISNLDMYFWILNSYAKVYTASQKQ